MMLDYNTAKKQCRFVSEHETVKFVFYVSGPMQSGTDSKKEALADNFKLISNNKRELSGSLIIFDKPSSAFCGDDFGNALSNATYFNHILPLRSWATEYVIPAFDEVSINRPFEAKLRIVSNADNTIVNITGGFDAVHAIYNRGDLITQDIDAGAAYKVTASQKIGVGLYIYDPVNTDKSSFHVLPPSQNLHDTVVTSAPNKLLETDGFDVTDITTYFVNGILATSTTSKDADDNGEFYRHLRLNSTVFGMTVVKSGNEKWFVIPGNTKSKVLYTEGKICNKATQTVGDNIDNDCDGLVNEDVSYSNYGVYRDDRDLDGGFGEDSSENFSEPVVVSKPIDPMCLEINKPANQCWIWTTCKCSMVKKLEAMKNMTKKELEEALQEDTKKIIKKLTTIFILGAITYSELSYERKFVTYEYPKWVILVGWTLAMCSVICVPAVFIFRLVRQKGSIARRFMESIKPTLKKHQLRVGEDLNKVNLVSEDLHQNFPDLTGLSAGSVMKLEGQAIYHENNEYDDMK